MSNILRKALTAVVGALFLSLFAIPTHAQSTDTSGSQGSILAVAGAESQEITADVQKEITELLNDTTDRFEQLDTDSVLGLGIGMLAGGVVADLLGGGGLVTLGGAVVGGFLGIWTAEKVF